MEHRQFAPRFTGLENIEEMQKFYMGCMTATMPPFGPPFLPPDQQRIREV